MACKLKSKTRVFRYNGISTQFYWVVVPETFVDSMRKRAKDPERVVSDIEAYNFEGNPVWYTELPESEHHVAFKDGL